MLSMGAMRPVTPTEDPTRGSALEIAIDADVRQPLVPGEPVVLRFSLTPAPVRLRAGETLRLDIGAHTCHTTTSSGQPSKSSSSALLSNSDQCSTCLRTRSMSLSDKASAVSAVIR